MNCNLISSWHRQCMLWSRYLSNFRFSPCIITVSHFY